MANPGFVGPAADLFTLSAARRGHFQLESGHHSDLWLDLETLCLRPRRVHPFAARLARQLFDVPG